MSGYPEKTRGQCPRMGGQGPDLGAQRGTVSGRVRASGGDL